MRYVVIPIKIKVHTNNSYIKLTAYENAITHIDSSLS